MHPCEAERVANGRKWGAGRSAAFEMNAAVVELNQRRKRGPGCVARASSGSCPVSAQTDHLRHDRRDRTFVSQGPVAIVARI